MAGKINKKRKELLEDIMRESLLEATRMVLAEHGWDGTTMDRVAARAGVAKGTIYNYFQDKTELMASLRGKLSQPYIDALQRIASGNGTALERLDRFVVLALEDLYLNAKLIRAIIVGHMMDRCFTLDKLTDPNIVPLKIHNILAGLITEGISSGEIKDVDPGAAATMIQGGIIEAMRQVTLFEKPMDREKLIGTFRSLLFDGIVKRGDRE
ncbi:TetR/AcrR family transcriptional regulator [Dethiosulfovibrio salsuginis]|uniref:Transcriptional regulator, TetR family n=1 Tax=Dethiosulfovibrio salsuginis TaxID=561720 RepID=A0A1X7IRB6_9BACT|nr:TetR/AcrR family transcriptional regulator [Dethiosulfovibrio salsuginis]SMG17598.1 transcriptional regulator, TetR family [Dethiosulfovibrio salsuginis]